MGFVVREEATSVINLVYCKHFDIGWHSYKQNMKMFRPEYCYID